MHGHTFELESDCASDLRFDIKVTSRETLDGGAVRPRVRNTRVPCNCLDQWGEPPWVPLEKAPFDAAVLVTKLDFEVMNLFPKAHEAKRTWLDDARVNRAHRDFVNFLPFDLVEGVGVHCRVFLPLVANRLEPRMGGDADARLLVKLSLKTVHGWHFRRQLVITELNRRPCPCHVDDTRWVAEYGRNEDVFVASLSIECKNPRPRVVPAQEVVTPRFRLEDRDSVDGDSMDHH
jgi:hypothetical protein